MRLCLKKLNVTIILKIRANIKNTREKRKKNRAELKEIKEKLIKKNSFNF